MTPSGNNCLYAMDLVLVCVVIGVRVRTHSKQTSLFAGSYEVYHRTYSVRQPGVSAHTIRLSSSNESTRIS